MWRTLLTMYFYSFLLQDNIYFGRYSSWFGLLLTLSVRLRSCKIKNLSLASDTLRGYLLKCTQFRESQKDGTTLLNLLWLMIEKSNSETFFSHSYNYSRILNMGFLGVNSILNVKSN